MRLWMGRAARYHVSQSNQNRATDKHAFHARILFKSVFEIRVIRGYFFLRTWAGLAYRERVVRPSAILIAVPRIVAPRIVVVQNVVPPNVAPRIVALRIVVVQNVAVQNAVPPNVAPRIAVIHDVVLIAAPISVPILALNVVPIVAVIQVLIHDRDVRNADFHEEFHGAVPLLARVY